MKYLKHQQIENSMINELSVIFKLSIDCTYIFNEVYQQMEHS